MTRGMSLLVFVILVALAAMLGGLAAPGDWYQALEKPDFNPPDWVFGPAWTLLYALMAVAAWRVRVSGHRRRGIALGWWGVQLVLNVAWSWLFFGLHRPGWALAEMSLLIVAVFVTWREFRGIDRPAGVMLLPYLAWLAFAWLLNAAIWHLNGGGIDSILV